MRTCRQVITTALRKLGVVGAGRRAPTAEDAADALEVLLAWYSGAVSSGMFGRLADVTTEAAYEAKEFERITILGADEVEITLPITITDDPLCDDRPPVDLCPVVIVATEPLNWLYDGAIGDWVALYGLTLDSDAPLSSRSGDGLACVLAVQLADEFGGQVGEITATRAAGFLSSLRTRNNSPRRSVDYDYL